MNITPEDARNFVMTLNSIAPYVPPMLFQNVTGSPISRLIQDVANGVATADVKPVKTNGIGERQQGEQEIIPPNRSN